MSDDPKPAPHEITLNGLVLDQVNIEAAAPNEIFTVEDAKVIEFQDIYVWIKPGFEPDPLL